MEVAGPLGTPLGTSGLPIKVVLLSLSHLSISLCAISCCLAQLDVRDSDSSFPVPALELGKCPGGVQWCSATKIWFLSTPAELQICVQARYRRAPAERLLCLGEPRQALPSF